jgi:hypothetical protein
MLILLDVALICYLLQPLCWDGTHAHRCPPPEPCWDGSHSKPCPRKPWVSKFGEGEDSKGKKAKFNIYVVTSEYSWEIKTPSINSPGKIRHNGKLEDLKFLKNFLQADDLSRVLKSADTIISFGTASC